MCAKPINDYSNYAFISSAVSNRQKRECWGPVSSSQWRPNEINIAGARRDPKGQKSRPEELTRG